jgi:hypothetical protein
LRIQIQFSGIVEGVLKTLMFKGCNSNLKDALNGYMTKIEKLPLKTLKDTKEDSR